MSGETFQFPTANAPISNVNKRAKMFAVCAWTQIAVSMKETNYLISLQHLPFINLCHSDLFPSQN
jgi:hypothetical protein